MAVLEIRVEVNELLLSSCLWNCFSTVTSNLGQMARTMLQKRGRRRFTEIEFFLGVSMTPAL